MGRGRVRAVFRYSLLGILGPWGVAASANSCFDPVFGKSGDAGRRVMKSFVDALPAEYHKFFDGIDPSDPLDRYTLELLVDALEIDDEVPMDVSIAAAEVLEAVLPKKAPPITGLRLPLTEEQLWSGIHPDVQRKIRNAGFEYEHPEWIRAFAGVDPGTPEGYKIIRELKAVADKDPQKNFHFRVYLQHLLQAFNPAAPTAADLRRLRKYMAIENSVQSLNEALVEDLKGMPAMFQKYFWNIDPNTRAGWEKLQVMKRHESKDVALVAEAILQRLRREGGSEIAKFEGAVEELERLGSRKEVVADLNPTVRKALKERFDLTADDLTMFKGIDPNTSAGIIRLHEVHARAEREIGQLLYENPEAKGEVAKRVRRLHIVREEAVKLFNQSTFPKKPVSSLGPLAPEDIDKLPGQIVAWERQQRNDAARREAWQAALQRVPQEYRGEFSGLDPTKARDLNELRRRAIDTRSSRTLRNIARDLVESLPGVGDKKVEEIRRETAFQTLLDEHHRVTLEPFPEAMRPYLTELDEHQLERFKGIDASRRADRAKLAKWAQSENVDVPTREACQRLLIWIPRAAARK